MARALLALAAGTTGVASGQRGLALETINGIPAPTHPLATLFLQEGFASSTPRACSHGPRRAARPDAMPEGDTIFRAAQTLHRALGGHVVTRFESVLPRLMRVDADHPVRGRTVDRVDARGKHLLIVFSGDLVLRTHMRMHGSAHLPPG